MSVWMLHYVIDEWQTRAGVTDWDRPSILHNHMCTVVNSSSCWRPIGMDALRCGAYIYAVLQSFWYITIFCFVHKNINVRTFPVGTVVFHNIAKSRNLLCSSAKVVFVGITGSGSLHPLSHWWLFSLWKPWTKLGIVQLTAALTRLLSDQYQYWLLAAGMVLSS